MNEKRIDVIMGTIRAELVRAMGLHPAHNSLHESFAVLDEERDELWDDVKKNRWPDALKEAVQVGAMAARFIHDEQERRDLPL